jgi:hypothetical protein
MLATVKPVPSAARKRRPSCSSYESKNFVIHELPPVCWLVVFILFLLYLGDNRRAVQYSPQGSDSTYSP